MQIDRKSQLQLGIGYNDDLTPGQRNTHWPGVNPSLVQHSGSLKTDPDSRDDELRTQQTRGVDPMLF